MKLYAERPHRAAGQLLADLLLVAWIGGWAWLGRAIHDSLDALRTPTAQVGNASSGLANSLSQTSDQLRDVQLVGEVLAAPFDAIVASARQLMDASDATQDTIARIADLSFVVTAVFPILFALTVWLVLRGRWVRHASAAARLRAAGYGDGLLAAQALSSVRLDRLVELAGSDNPLDDPISRRRLAAYQLQRLGLRSQARDRRSATSPSGTG
jgi:hypothetical protein